MRTFEIKARQIKSCLITTISLRLLLPLSVLLHCIHKSPCCFSSRSPCLPVPTSASFHPKHSQCLLKTCLKPPQSGLSVLPFETSTMQSIMVLVGHFQSVSITTLHKMWSIKRREKSFRNTFVLYFYIDTSEKTRYYNHIFWTSKFKLQVGHKAMHIIKTLIQKGVSGSKTS